MAGELSGRPGADQKAIDDPLKPHVKRRESGREIRIERDALLEKAEEIEKKVSSSPPPKSPKKLEP